MGTLHRLDPKAFDITALPAAWAGQIKTGRELAAEKRRREPDGTRFLATASALDRLLDGGLERGALTELVGGRSSGRFALLLSVLAAATQAGEASALVDLGDGFDPRAAAAAGVELELLLWARPRRVKDVLVSAEAIIKAGLPLVIVDLGLPPLAGGRGAEGSWRRLTRAAREHGAALLLTTPYRLSGSAAGAVLELRDARSRWGGRGAAPRLLRGLGAELELVKSRRPAWKGENRARVDWGAAPWSSRPSRTLGTDRGTPATRCAPGVEAATRAIA